MLELENTIALLEGGKKALAFASGVAALAHGNDALLIVDNTFLTSYFQRPFDFGADLVVYSGSKYLCGHNDLIRDLGQALA